MENPTKIEIEGLKTIHKLCKFGADHNMEGCSFTEIVERMFDELQQAQKVAVPEGFVLVPKTNSDKGIESMAMRYRHDFPLLEADYQEGIKSQMRQLYEEAVGLGFYSHKAQEQSKPVEIDRDTARHKLAMMWRGESTEINGRTVIFNESGCFDVRQNFGSWHFSQSLKATLNYLFGANQ